MQKTLSRSRTEPRQQSELAVDILSVATATPQHKVTQTEAFARASLVFPHLARLDGLYANTGIERRYACEPAEWYVACHGWEERTNAFQRHALDLLERVACAAVERADLALADIGMIVMNTTTGLAVPSLDAKLINRLELPATMERLPIFGLGCGGGVAGLARAARLAQGMPGANVLFLTVELCTLCARPNDPSVAMFISAALFGDGAAGVVLRAHSGKSSGAGPALGTIRAAGEQFWRDSEHIMGWDIKEDGFGVVLSPELPALLREKLKPALLGFLERQDMHLEEFAGFLIHSGGSKILETAEDALGLRRGALAHSWSVLRDFGNMSSATVLFVLERALAAGATGRHLLAALGPGFSAYFLVADLAKK